MAADEFKVYLSLDPQAEKAIEPALDKMHKHLVRRAKEMGLEAGAILRDNLKLRAPVGTTEWDDAVKKYISRPWMTARQKTSALMDQELRAHESHVKKIAKLDDQLARGNITQSVYEQRKKRAELRYGRYSEKLQRQLEGEQYDDPLTSLNIPVSYQVPETEETRKQRARQEDLMRRTLESRRKAIFSKQQEAAARAEKAGIPFETFSEQNVIEYEKLINANIQALNNQIKLAKAQAMGSERMREALDAYSQATTGQPYAGTDVAKDYEAMRKQSRKEKQQQAEALKQKKKVDAEFNKYLTETYEIPALKRELEANAKFLGQPVPQLRGTTQEQRIKEMKKIHAVQREEMSDRYATSKYEQDKWKHIAMSSASLGIGLFGNAAMPMLNVAFSAWSGGIKMAGLAAVATIIGESYRNIELLRDAAKQAADSLSYVSRASSKLQSKEQAIQAFYGGMVQDQLDLSMGRSNKFARRNMRELIQFEAGWGGMKSGFGYATDEYKQKVLGDLSKKGAFWGSLNSIINLPFDIGPFAADWMTTGRKDAAKLEANFIKNNELRLKELETMRLGGTVGIENDPYQIWLRTQNSLLDPTKQREQDLIQEQIAVLKELNAAIRFDIEDRNKPKIFKSAPDIDAKGNRRKYNPFTEWEWWAGFFVE